MSAIRIAGVVLLILGILALTYGGFTYTQETHDAKLGPFEFQVKEKKQVNVPIWAGVGAALVGASLLVFRGRKRLA